MVTVKLKGLKMVKTKTLGKQKAPSKKQSLKIDVSRFQEMDPLGYITNKGNVLRAIAECLQKEDLAGIIEVSKIYLDAKQMRKQYSKASSKKLI